MHVLNQDIENIADYYSHKLNPEKCIDASFGKLFLHAVKFDAKNEIKYQNAYNEYNYDANIKNDNLDMDDLKTIFDLISLDHWYGPCTAYEIGCVEDCKFTALD
jgi:hypothetical protein